MNDALLNFKGIIDEEIQAYESLGELYKIKHSVLVSGKSEALWDVDALIVKKADSIKELMNKRKEVAKYLGDENISLSEVIEKAKVQDRDLVENFVSQKAKLGLLAKSLTLQETTNMTLIKHGLTMVEKTIDIIFNAVSPQGNNYDKSGHNVKDKETFISSVIEEV